MPGTVGFLQALPLLSPISGAVPEFAECARKAGVEVTLEVWEGMWHVWQMTTPLVPEASRAVKHIGLFVEQHLGH